MRGDSREIEGRLGGMNFLVVGTTMEAALVLGFLGEDDSGGGGTFNSGIEAEETRTVKALSDMVNGLGGSWRRTSIPCPDIQVVVCRR
jgi:hypothetical protein